MDEDGHMTDLVWYAAYGSNLFAPRFMTYLTGGFAPHRPSDRAQQGARDPAPPRADRPWPLRHQLFFGGSSPNWSGGAIAMLDQHHSPDHPTLARIWLVSSQQFEDVFLQENRRPVPDPADQETSSSERLFQVEDLAAGAHVDVADSSYGRVLNLGPGPGGHPVVTFVGPDPGRHQRGPGHLSYLRTIGLGLMECWGLSLEAATSYLVTSEGNAGAVSADDIRADLARWSD